MKLQRWATSRRGLSIQCRKRPRLDVPQPQIFASADPTRRPPQMWKQANEIDIGHHQDCLGLALGLAHPESVGRPKEAVSGVA